MASATPSAPAYGRSLAGLGFNLIVRDIEQQLRFCTQVLEAEIFFRTDQFAALRLCGMGFMLHADATYRDNVLRGSLADKDARGVGVELRAYEVDPDKAEARARDGGWTVLAGSADKPHGLRECVLMDDEGFVWVPSRRLEANRP